MPKDILGNELQLNDIICYHPDRHLIGKVVAVQEGGLAVAGHPNAKTPALVRVVFDITVGCPSGGTITPFVKVISPGSDELIKQAFERAAVQS